MTNVSLKNQLKMCSAYDFFEIIEKYVECRIPCQMRNILRINSCTSAIALSRGCDTLVSEIEHFMKYQFNDDMLTSGESMKDYLGIFVNDKRNFKLLSGQKRMLQVLHEYCRLLYPTTDETKLFESGITSSMPSQETATIVPYDYVPSLIDNQGLLTLFVLYDEIVVNDIDLFKIKLHYVVELVHEC